MINSRPNRVVWTDVFVSCVNCMRGQHVGNIKH